MRCCISSRFSASATTNDSHYTLPTPIMAGHTRSPSSSFTASKADPSRVYTTKWSPAPSRPMLSKPVAHAVTQTMIDRFIDRACASNAGIGCLLSTRLFPSIALRTRSSGCTHHRGIHRAGPRTVRAYSTQALRAAPRPYACRRPARCRRAAYAVHPRARRHQSVAVVS